MKIFHGNSFKKAYFSRKIHFEQTFDMNSTGSSHENPSKRHFSCKFLGNTHFLKTIDTKRHFSWKTLKNTHFYKEILFPRNLSIFITKKGLIFPRNPLHNSIFHESRKFDEFCPFLSINNCCHIPKPLYNSTILFDWN